MKILTAVAVAAALLLGGCAKKDDTPDAVKQGVVRDLASKFDMTKMDVVVDAVSFRDKEADATVTFVPKGMTASQGMTMRYVMERHDDGLWYIKTRASGIGGAPSASGALPTGHPAMGAGTMGAGMGTEAPAGATPASGSKFNLPAGHPELGQ